jgi:prophage regulatory protein
MQQGTEGLNPRRDISRIIPIAEVVARTSLSRRTIYNMMGAGGFPQPVQLSARRVGWREDAVARWIEQRLNPGAAA